MKTVLIAAVLLLSRQAPAAEVDGSSAPLSLAAAAELAVQNNLQVRLARARGDAARGEALRAAGALLPNLTGSASQSRTFKENLVALGFNFPGFPSLLGPFNTFDARIQLVQKVFDLPAFRRRQSAVKLEEAARSEEALAREQVAGAAALAYIEALRADKAARAAEADLDLALALASLADKQHGAGVATGVDVVRAATVAEQARLKLLQIEVARRDAELRLKRVAGLPLGLSLRLSDVLSSSAPAAPGVEAAVASALSERLELKVARDRLEADRMSEKAASERFLPSVTAAGNYGLSGDVPSGGKGTGGVGVALSVPLWTGGQLKGGREEASAEAGASQSVLDDLSAQVETDVRLALANLDSAAEQVRTAEHVVSLAERELKLTRDRFASGVGDNIELVSSQDSLARAHDSEVAALSQFDVARINLALAMGRMGAFRL